MVIFCIFSLSQGVDIQEEEVEEGEEEIVTGTIEDGVATGVVEGGAVIGMMEEETFSAQTN